MTPSNDTSLIDIDAVARRMTSGAPASDLRGAVLARLEPRRPGRVMWWLAPAGALTAVALLVVSATPRNAVTPESAAPVAGTAARIESTVVPAGAPAPAPDATARETRRAGRPAGPAPSPAQLAWRARAVPALDTIEALTFAAIQPDVLSIPQLEVKPIVTAPIETGAGDGGIR